MGNKGKLILVSEVFASRAVFMKGLSSSLGCSVGIIVVTRHEYGLDRPDSASSNRVLVDGKLVTRPSELNITFKPQCNENRTANLTTNHGKKTVTGKHTR